MSSLPSLEWDELLGKFPNAHILQTSEWGQLKSQFGWESVKIVLGTAGVQILFRKVAFLSIAYIPKGPVGTAWHSLLPLIEHECKKRRAIFLLLEADLWEDEPDSELQSFLSPGGMPRFRAGTYSIQPRRTFVINLDQTESQLLSSMKQKTRYNIRLAEKKGVRVQVSSDMVSFSHLMQLTGNRDNFPVHQPRYYEEAYRLFEPGGNCALFIADLDGEPLAGLMVFRHGNRAWYFYGASSNHHRETMPAYLLQWQAMMWAKNHGCKFYDLWGVPDEDESFLEENFHRYTQGLWGVYRFKRGFGGILKRTVRPIEVEFIPFAYKFYRYLKGRRGNADGA